MFTKAGADRRQSPCSGKQEFQANPWLTVSLTERQCCGTDQACGSGSPSLPHQAANGGRPRMADDTGHRQIVHRLFPGSRKKVRRLAALAHRLPFRPERPARPTRAAARLAGVERLTRAFRSSRLDKAFIRLRRLTPCLQEMSQAQADAWQRCFRGLRRPPEVQAARA